MTEEKKLPWQQNRGRGEVGKLYFKETYNEFIKTKNNSLSRSIDFTTYTSIMRSLYIKMAMCILNGNEVALPCRMGNILVNKKVSDNRGVIDFKSTVESGKLILEFNHHTNGHRFSFKWRKADPIVGIQKGYLFRSSRSVRRSLAKILKDGGGYKYQSLSNKKVQKNEV